MSHGLEAVRDVRINPIMPSDEREARPKEGLFWRAGLTLDMVGANLTGMQRLLALSPRAVFLTHYSQVTDVARLGADLLRLIDAHEQLGLQWTDGSDAARRQQALTAGVRQMVEQEARRVGGDPRVRQCRQQR